METKWKEEKRKDGEKRDPPSPEQVKFTFEEIFKQNERRIHYHIHRLGIRDPHHEFYSEGLYAMWHAYRKYEPDKGPLSTYFNFAIRNRLIDLIRKNHRTQERDEHFKEEEKKQQIAEWKNAHGEAPSSELEECEMWEEVKKHLTEKQWDWVYYYIIQDMPLKEIAKLKGVSVEAVKSWGKEARRKLRQVLKEP